MLVPVGSLLLGSASSMNLLIPLRNIFNKYPLGLIVVFAVAMVSSLLILTREKRPASDIEMWVFNPEHQALFVEVAHPWNDDDQLPTVDVQLVEMQSLSRRMLSGFFSGTPVADLIMAERTVASQAWRGPEEAIGFFDLTDILEAEGIRERINPPSFAPWTVNERIYGIPVDVHPVMLIYRADLYEEAGIAIETARTWQEFMQMSLPLIGDLNGNGIQDRFILEMPEYDGNVATMLVLQAGGDLFDAYEQPTLNHPINIRVMKELVYWTAQEPSWTVDIPMFTGSGERLRAEGIVLAWLAPDWRAGRTMRHMPALSGKLKLMPLPPWEVGGLRTSVWGGTMIGFSRNNKGFENSWEFAKELVFNRIVARSYWETMMIITPAIEFWDDPVYDQNIEYFSDQAVGRLLIEMAPDVPERSSSVYYTLAIAELANALNRLGRQVRTQGIRDRDVIQAMVERELAVAQENVKRVVERNIFQDR